MQLFISSGDLIADRRYELAKELEKRGDLAGAASIYEQAVEVAPAFATAWFALGEVRERLSDGSGAISAYRNARRFDPEDRQGAAVRIARLTQENAPMPAGYVRELFDQYARHYDLSLTEGLEYRGPKLLRDAVSSACDLLGRTDYFDRGIDLGCGTGLAGEVFAPVVMPLVGVDLSTAMIEQARKTGAYASLHVGEFLEFLATQEEDSAGIVIAADTLPYCHDLCPIAAAVAHVLETGGLFAFTVETCDGGGVILRETLRYAHGLEHVRAALGDAGLSCVQIWAASSRNEKNVPVPGLVVVAAKPASTVPPSDAKPCS